jgi:RNA polymerase sigma factor (sigma-70 family)
MAFLRLMPAPSSAAPNESREPTRSSPRATSDAPLPRMSDLDLFEAIQVNDAGWQRQAYDEFLPLVRGLVVRSLGPKLETEDLIADVFVALFENARNIRSADGLRSYIVSIVMNLVRRELRRRRRRTLLGFSDEERRLSERVPSTDDPKAKTALHLLSQILKTLDTDDHLVFSLCALEGFKLEEAADTLGISVSSVKRRLKRATENLEKRVQQNPLLADYVHERGIAHERGGREK